MDSLEHLCERCGVSCRAALRVDGQLIVIEDLHCPYLTSEEGVGAACEVYEERFEKAPWCLHSSEAGPRGALRDGCPYSPGAQGKVVLSESAYQKAWPRLRDKLLAQKSVGLHFTWEKFFRAAEKRDVGYRWHLETSWSGSSGRIRRTRKSAVRRAMDWVKGGG